MSNSCNEFVCSSWFSHQLINNWNQPLITFPCWTPWFIINRQNRSSSIGRISLSQFQYTKEHHTPTKHDKMAKEEYFVARLRIYLSENGVLRWSFGASTSRNQHANIISVQQSLCQLRGFSALRCILIFCHIVQNHIDEIIETKELAGELTVALHDYPYSWANTSINQLQWQNLRRHEEGGCAWRHINVTSVLGQRPGQCIGQTRTMTSPKRSS